MREDFGTGGGNFSRLTNSKNQYQQINTPKTFLYFQTSVVMSLLQSYGLLDKMNKIVPEKASTQELLSFHSRDYLDFCDKISESTDQEKLSTYMNDKLKSASSSLETEFGVEYDCPIVENLSELVGWLAGGSLSAAKWLTAGFGNRAINWGGGWHHAQRDKASGFCYVNDIVIAIHELRRKYDKILYIDLDVHHGDGVENAFAFTKKVFTFSMHKYSFGYFPGTGNLSDIGLGAAKYHCMNIPLKDGLNDYQYNCIFTRLFKQINSEFKPEAFVIQCGADCLNGDPLGGLNLTPGGMKNCINIILETADIKPCLFLGGGGYDRANAARYWTTITSAIIGNDENEDFALSNDVPEHPFFSLHGTSFELSVDKGLRASKTTSTEIDTLTNTALRNLNLL